MAYNHIHDWHNCYHYHHPVNGLKPGITCDWWSSIVKVSVVLRTTVIGSALFIIIRCLKQQTFSLTTAT